MQLGLAISAFTQDVGVDFIYAREGYNLDEEDYNAAMTDVLQRSGYIWRATKHVPWIGPLIKSLPASLIERFGNDGTKVMIRSRQVGNFPAHNPIDPSKAIYILFDYRF